MIALLEIKSIERRLAERKDRERDNGIDLELARLRYPHDTKEHLYEKIADYRWLVQDTLTSLKAKYPQESEISHFKRIQEFCMQTNVIFESEDDIPIRVQKMENFCWILDMVLTAMDDRYPNEKEEYHMEKIQEFCLAISNMVRPIDIDTAGIYDTEENRAKEMADFYWFLNGTLTSMKSKYPHETKEYHIKKMEEYLWFADMIFNSSGNIDQSQVKKIKEYWGLEENA